MRSTSTKRGLATAAVAALAVCGIQWSAAADSVNTQVGDGNVVLYSQFNAGNQTSLKFDGTDRTIHLEAGAGANIPSIKFQYSLDGTNFIDITTVANRNADGTFAFEWDASALAGSTVTLRATGTPAGTTTPVNKDQAGVAIQGGGTADNTVNITDGTTLGYFQQPYAGPNNTTTAIVSGTTSATSGNVAISRRLGTGAIAGAAVNAPVSAAQGATTGTFAGVLDITGYAYDTNTDPAAQVNQLVVGAERDTDDVEAFSLKRQVITTVTAVADKTQVTTGNSASVTVTVLDADGKPIAGAQVVSSSTAAGVDPKYTDAKGQVVYPQPAGTEYYYANADGNVAYDANAGDKRSTDVAITSFSPAATSLKGASVDGPAFDFDENAASDVTVQVADQAGNPFATGILPPRTVEYYWVLTPFDGTPATVRFPATSTSTTTADANGKANIAIPTGATAEDGKYELFAGLRADLMGNGAIPSAKVLEVKIGQAAITYSAVSPQQAVAGGSAPVNGKLALSDGTALPGRVVNLTYTPGTEAGTGAGAGDSGLVPATGSALVTSLAVTTGADGAFTATVKDPTETPQPTETGGDLDAATGATTKIGNAGATKNDQKFNFLTSVTSSGITIDPETPLVTGLKTPARPVRSQVKVTTADGTALANQSVMLTADKGFFTPDAATFAALTPDPAAVAGADAGEFKSLGQSITVTTDANGVAFFTLAIEKDAGFDDDGAVNAVVTATTGTLTDTETVDWTSASPYNGGATEIVLSPDSVQQSSVLPKAPVGDTVFFDVFTTDQFGNRVGGQPVALSDNVGNAEPSAATATSDFSADGDFSVTSSAAQDQVVTATWTAPTNKYAVPPAVVTGTEALSGTGTVNWYEVDYAASTFGLTRTPAGDNLPVGTTVTETYTAEDQNGEPIADLYAQFFRSGAGGSDTGAPVFEGLTGQDGTIEFVFQGSQQGAATISVIGRDGSPTANTVPQAAKSDSVTFGEVVTPPVQTAINARLSGKALANGKDKLTVNARKANGAVVKLYAITNGKAKLVAKGRLNARGTKVFRVADKNKKKATQYAAIVSATPDTRQDTTNVVRVK